MATLGQGSSHSKVATQKPLGNFADSLVENEQKSKQFPNAKIADEINPFANALLNSSGQNQDAFSGENILRQQEEWLLKQKKDALCRTPLSLEKQKFALAGEHHCSTDFIVY